MTADEAIKKAEEAIDKAEGYEFQYGNSNVDAYHRVARTYLLLAIAKNSK